MPSSERSYHTEKSENITFDIHDERGVIPVGLALGLGRIAISRKTAGRAIMAAAILTAGSAAAYQPTINSFQRNVSVEAAPSFEEVSVEQETQLLALNTEVPLGIADAYFKTQANVENIENRIHGTAFGITATLYKFNTNVELNGIGTIDFRLPYEAITVKEGANGATDFVVDVSRMGVRGGWAAGSPAFQYYTINDGGKNYGDTTGFRNSALKAASAAAGIANFNALENLYDKIQQDTEHDINVFSLDRMTKDCPPQLEDEIYEAIEIALKRNTDSMSQDGEFGKVEFINKPMKYTREEVPQAVYDSANEDDGKLSMTTLGNEPKGENVITTCTTTNPESESKTSTAEGGS